MLTGLEVSIIHIAAVKMRSELSTDQVKAKADEILFKPELADLMAVLFELNRPQALRNTAQWKRARAICDSINTVQGSKFILFRYISARTAYSLAKSYERRVKKDTASAKMQTYMKPESQQPKRKQRQSAMEAQIDYPTEEDHSSITHQSPAPSPERSASQYILRSSSMISFGYPQGTPENPAIHCPVGSELTIPKGLKPGNIIFYPLSQASSHQVRVIYPWSILLHSSMILTNEPSQCKSHASSHHIDTSISGNRSVDNASELIAEADHLAEILVSINNSNVSIATTFYSLDINNETDAGGSDCESSGDLTSDC
ncbi:hypothetical protein DFJ43DRAFT_1093334 [Lentinula guzmanii]|uniref:Uncharacterized protein n=1 Tax=Lentinula guzmanii TaxID=2804957 RepID=A0AA38MS04_9AGAR|nr:hypothetical protein DFJ43DRAFT_1093334 [Lentinula guzmanii]